jgi:steroid delta-isomerase-like uncharacterized protein
MSEQENIQRVHDRVALLNARDFSSYVAPLDDSFVGESGSVPGGLRGPESVQQQLLMMMVAFPDLHIEVEQVIASGDFVVSCVKLTGTHKGPYAGIPATNKTVSWGVCTVSEVRNGKTVRSRLYGDNGSLFRQIGGGSVPGATAVE